tara:strand:+ start:706 stop:1074 length:369 start_codon:yes stop_codon:yes gene_type:complete
MQLFDEINDDNLLIFASRHYYNPKCIDVEEFYEDLNRFKYVKRLVNRYIESERLSDRLILNHLIVIFNVFGVEASIKILRFKLNNEHWKVIKPFLIFLKHIEPTDFIDIEMDDFIVQQLRKI